MRKGAVNNENNDNSTWRSKYAMDKHKLGFANLEKIIAEKD